MSYVKPIRYSGYRISLMPLEEQQPAWEARLSDISYLMPTIQQALSEEFFCDDRFLDMPFDRLIQYILQSGEIFVCVNDIGEEMGGARRELVGFVLLRDIVPGRDAWIEAWTHPAYRGKFPCSKQFKDILDYCFTPWNPEQLPSQRMSPKGLGLRKLKAAFSSANTPAATALWRCGFFVTGHSPADGLFKGKLTDIITVEKINPALLPRELPNVRSRETAVTAEPDTNASVLVAGTLSERAIKRQRLRVAGAKRDEREGSGSERTGQGSLAGPEQLREWMAEPEEQSNGRDERVSSAERLPRASKTGRAAATKQRASKRARGK